jgi:hypothetical protein
MSILAKVRNIVDGFMGGRGEHSITVPVMDGALKPNDYLERSRGIATIPEADNITAVGGDVFLTSGVEVLRRGADGKFEPHARYDAVVTSLAASPDGSMAIGLEGRGFRIAGGKHDGKTLPTLQEGVAFICPTAATFIDDDTLVVCSGSTEHSTLEWNRDLLALGRSGSVWVWDIDSDNMRHLKGNLAYPAGVCVEGADTILVSEAWKHRIVSMDLSGSGINTVLDGLPAYPGRIMVSPSGGYWLSLFAVRSQLQEFVLREDRYRRQMMATIDPEFWIAPALSSGRSFKEPLQAGGVIRLGIHKPWAPTKSYGLILRLDADAQPVWSAHSRADGSRHGITSTLELNGTLLATSKGKGELISIDHVEMSEPDNLTAELESLG